MTVVRQSEPKCIWVTASLERKQSTLIGVEAHASSYKVVEKGDPSGPKVQIKDLVLGGTLTSIKDRDDYLKQQADAQFSVPESELVAGVRRVLARHKA